MKTNQEIVEFNKSAWNRQVLKNNTWTIPVDTQTIDKARNGQFEVLLTPTKIVPRNWFPTNMHSTKILALASGGGQQAPLFAAAGAEVYVLDNSPLQLSRDQEVADRENLKLHLYEGDMMDLSIFANESFDFIFHPCSNVFVPNVKQVWTEAYRVLKKNGRMISGMVNPVLFTYDIELEKQGIIQMKYSIPYSDLNSITPEERIKYFGEDEPLSFGHSLQDLIGGQTNAGFYIKDFYEDSWPADKSQIHKYINCYFATNSIKL